MTARCVFGWGISIAGGFLIVIGVIAGIATKFSAGKFEGWPFLLIVAAATFYGGRKCYILGKKMRSVSAEDVLRKDVRPPVLYLRSFVTDNLGEKRPLTLPLFVPSTFLTEEEEIALVMNQIGPFITIGHPEEYLRTLGASRFYPEEWQKEVVALIKQSALIIMRVGETESLLWEFEKCVDENALQKVIFLLPKNTEEYESFRLKTTNLFREPLPDYCPREGIQASLSSIGGVLYFDNNLLPHIENLASHIFSNSIHLKASELVAALGPLLQLRGLSGFSFQQPLLVTRLASVLLDAVIPLACFAPVLILNNSRGMLYAIIALASFFTVEGALNCRTVGKSLFNLTVRDKYGWPITPYQSYLRVFLKFISLLMPLWIISLYLLLTGKVPLHDRLAHTTVVTGGR